METCVVCNEEIHEIISFCSGMDEHIQRHELICKSCLEIQIESSIVAAHLIPSPISCPFNRQASSSDAAAAHDQFMSGDIFQHCPNFQAACHSPFMFRCIACHSVPKHLAIARRFALSERAQAHVESREDAIQEFRRKLVTERNCSTETLEQLFVQTILDPATSPTSFLRESRFVTKHSTSQNREDLLKRKIRQT